MGIAVKLYYLSLHNKTKQKKYLQHPATKNSRKQNHRTGKAAAYFRGILGKPCKINPYDFLKTIKYLHEKPAPVYVSMGS